MGKHLFFGAMFALLGVGCEATGAATGANSAAASEDILCFVDVDRLMFADAQGHCQARFAVVYAVGHCGEFISTEYIFEDLSATVIQSINLWLDKAGLTLGVARDVQPYTAEDKKQITDIVGTDPARRVQVTQEILPNYLYVIDVARQIADEPCAALDYKTKIRLARADAIFATLRTSRGEWLRPAAQHIAELCPDIKKATLEKVNKKY